MAKTKISEFNANPALNTDIDSINIAEGCAPSGINDAIRELMSQLKDWQSGTSNDPYVVGSSGSLTLNQGTANGVAYLNGSKVVTSGSALTFDGSALLTTGRIDIQNANALQRFLNGSGTRTGYFQVRSDAFEIWSDQSAIPMVFGVSNAEQMRLTSTGLGIGTSSPAYKLDTQIALTGTAAGDNTAGYFGSLASGRDVNIRFGDSVNASARIGYLSGALYMYTNGAERMRLDSSGNLGLGVTPSAWSIRALQVGSGYAAWSSGVTNARMFANTYYDGSYKYMGTGRATQYEQDGYHAWFTAPSGTAGNAITFTQAMTLDASGNLVIGGTTANQKLQVTGTGPVGIRINDTNTNYWDIINNSYLAFIRGGTEAVRIDSSGNLLVGTTSSSETTDKGVRCLASGYLATTTNNENSLAFYNKTAGAYRFFVSAAGTINATSTSITAISDQTLKKNIRDLETGLSEVMSLRPRRFDWKEETLIEEKNVAGFIAQEVEQVLPELVYQYQYSENEKKKSLKMGDILPTLVKAIQEQQAIIESLKARLDAANL